MAKTVADQFAETLAAAGVKRIYGIVGDSLRDLHLHLRVRRFLHLPAAARRTGWTPGAAAFARRSQSAPIRRRP